MRFSYTILALIVTCGALTAAAPSRSLKRIDIIPEDALDGVVMKLADGVGFLFGMQKEILESKVEELRMVKFDAPEWMILDVFKGKEKNEPAAHAYKEMVDLVQEHFQQGVYEAKEIRYLKVLAGRGKDSEAREILAGLPPHIRQSHGVDEVLNPRTSNAVKAVIVGGAVAGGAAAVGSTGYAVEQHIEDKREV